MYGLELVGQRPTPWLQISLFLLVSLITGSLLVRHSSRDSSPLIVVVLFFGGLCRSMQFTALNTLGFADVSAEQMSAATTFSSVVQPMTMGMGVAAGAIALRVAAIL